MTKSSEYKPRFYRELMGNTRWRSFRAEYLETDLWIAVSAWKHDKTVERYARERIVTYRHILDDHIALYPDFLTSLCPLEQNMTVHPMISEMYEASFKAGTGPMSAVAGAVAEYTCIDLIKKFGFDEVVIENGGDIYMKLKSPATISVYAGESPLSDKIGLIIQPTLTPLSVCCSSATVGHSMSFGIADACAIACRSGAQADAYATACCNAVKNIDMLNSVTEQFLQKTDILSVVIIKDDKVGLGGKIEISVL